jgi:hypothetical protein
MRSVRLELLDIAEAVLQSHLLEANCLLNQMVVHPEDGADFCLGQLTQNVYSVEPFVQEVQTVQLVLLHTHSWQRPLTVAELSIYSFECSGGGKESSFVAEIQDVSTLSLGPSGLYATTELGDLFRVRVGEPQLSCEDVWYRLEEAMLQWNPQGDVGTFVTNISLTSTDRGPTKWQFELQKKKSTHNSAAITRMLICAHQMDTTHAAPRRCCEKQSVLQEGDQGHLDLDLKTARSKLLVGQSG